MARSSVRSSDRARRRAMYAQRHYRPPGRLQAVQTIGRAWRAYSLRVPRRRRLSAYRPGGSQYVAARRRFYNAALSRV